MEHYGELRVGEHSVQRVTDCPQSNQSRSLCAQNVPLCTKCPLCAVAARGLGPGLFEPFEPVTAVHP